MEAWLGLLGQSPPPAATTREAGVDGPTPGPHSPLEDAATHAAEPPPNPAPPPAKARQRWPEGLAAVGILIGATLLIADRLGLPIALLALLAWLALTGALYLAVGRRRGRGFLGLSIPGWNLVLLLRPPAAAPAPRTPPPAQEPPSELSIELPDDHPLPPIQAVFDTGRFSDSALPIHRRRLVIGRDHDVQPRLDTLEVSRHHLAVTLEPGPPPALLLEDLGSRNGSFVAVARNDGHWSEWRRLQGSLRIAVGEHHRWRVRLGEDGDQFHFE